MVQPPQAHNHGTIWQQYEWLILPIHDDNKMSYNYIISITYIWMSLFNPHNPIYCKENKEGIRKN